MEGIFAEESSNNFKKREYEELLAIEKQLDEELKICEEKCNKAYKIKLLHKYNELKDAAQILLGSIANMEGISIREVHLNFDLPLDE